MSYRSWEGAWGDVVIRLCSIQLRGFKSIHDANIELRPLNILIGANGAGKSNLVSFFSMIQYMLMGRLQFFVGKFGGAGSILHYGPGSTDEISATVEFDTGLGRARYHARWSYAAPDLLVFAEEAVGWAGEDGKWLTQSLGTGHRESALSKPEASLHPMALLPRSCLSECHVFHFHDTSDTSGVRRNCEIANNSRLLPDASNLAAILYLYEAHRQPYYQRIVGTIRQVTPFFDDFILRAHVENERMTSLRWRERESEYVFGPHQLSDGTVRAVALITLLFQREDNLPRVLVVDEPELGLHPYAMEIIAGLFQAAALHTQVIVATQSTFLLDQFSLDDVIVIDREEKETTFSRPPPDDLADWLKEYSLSELWEKNVLGGTPGR